MKYQKKIYLFFLLKNGGGREPYLDLAEGPTVAGVEELLNSYSYGKVSKGSSVVFLEIFKFAFSGCSLAAPEGP